MNKYFSFVKIITNARKAFAYFLYIIIFNTSITQSFAQWYITTFAGGAVSGLGDFGPATNAHLLTPSGVCVDNIGNVYFSDQNDCRIRMVDTFGTIYTIAGTGPIGYLYGDGGPADSAKLNWPEGVAVDTNGFVYIADNNNNVIRVVKYGFIYRLAGTGYVGDSVNGGPATAAKLWHPADITVDKAGNVYFVDQNNHKMKKVDTGGIITTIAGTGMPGYNGDNIPASAAQLNFPEGISVDTAGNVYIADLYNNRVRKVNMSTLIITSIAGGDTSGYSGDGGPATNALLFDPSAVCVDKNGNIFITDWGNSRIRKIDSVGIISTLAGCDSFGFSGDGGPATNAKLGYPQGVAADSKGNIYIADYENYRGRKVYWHNPSVSAEIIPTERDISIYPNPTWGKFFIHSQVIETGSTFDIYNEYGQKIYSDIFNIPTKLIDLTNYRPGAYLVKIEVKNHLNHSDGYILKRVIIVD